jgi:XTP/dITP diphosphohydrolase
MADRTSHTLVLATRNHGKAREMRALLRHLLRLPPEIAIASLRDYPALAPIEETGATFQDNAQLKALAVANFTGCIAIGDDSGLVVDALDGAPGVHSARYAGPHARDEENNRKLLEALRAVPADRRGAHFICVVVVALPGNVLGSFEGVCHGMIGFEPRGANGFGYDPLFIKTDYGKTFAELSHTVKNRISHRTLAFEKAATVIARYFDHLHDATEPLAS